LKGIRDTEILTQHDDPQSDVMSLKTLLIHSIFAELERPRLPLHPFPSSRMRHPLRGARAVSLQQISGIREQPPQNPVKRLSPFRISAQDIAIRFEGHPRYGNIDAT
jgi:hypothetical protein